MDCLGDWPLCEVVPLVEEANHRGRPIVFVGSGTERYSGGVSADHGGSRRSDCRSWTVRSEPEKHA